jgi:hypothetical protein
MLMSSLRKYVKALSGTVHVMVELKGQPAFELEKIGRKATAKVRGKTPAWRREHKAAYALNRPAAPRYL